MLESTRFRRRRFRSAIAAVGPDAFAHATFDDMIEEYERLLEA